MGWWVEGRVRGRDGRGYGIGHASNPFPNPQLAGRLAALRICICMCMCMYLGVVEGHLGEDVVADVGVGDVVEGVVEQPPKGAVNGAERAAEPGPLLC